MRHGDSAENSQPPRAALHVPVTKQRIGLMGRDLVRLLAMLAQEPVGVPRQLQFIVVAVFPACGRRTGRVHRPFPPRRERNTLPYRGFNSEASTVAPLVRNRTSVTRHCGSAQDANRQMLLWSPGTPSSGGAPLVLTGSTLR